MYARGVARGSWGARVPLLYAFLSKQPTADDENDVTIWRAPSLSFDTV